MRFGRSISLPKEFCFPVRKSAIRAAFGEFIHLSCHFGSLSHHFRFDSRCFEQPMLYGPVVASLSVSRTRSAILQIYPIRIESYPSKARSDFETKVVPSLRTWLSQQVEKPETAVLGHEEMIITWDRTIHRHATVRFL